MNKLFILAALTPFILQADIDSDYLFEETHLLDNSTNLDDLFDISDNSNQQIPEDKQVLLIDSNPQEYFSIIEFGPSYTHTSIKIHNQPLYHGNLGGAQAIYEYKPFNSLYLGLSSTYKQGTLDNTLGKRNYLYVDVHERIGYTFVNSNKRSRLSLYTGAGYRHYGHNLKQDSSKIQFDYNEFYIPVGLKSSYNFNTWIVGALNFMWMPQVNSSVKIIPLHGARWCLKKSFSNFLVEVPLTFFLTKNHKYSMSFKPFYEYWQDGASTAFIYNETLGLPGNSYNFWGAELNFGFYF